MASSSSITTFSVHSHQDLHSSKTLKPYLHNTLKLSPICPTQIHKPLSFCTKFKLTAKLNDYPNHSNPPNPKQLSQFHHILDKTQKKLTKFLAEKVVAILVGSFMLMGFLNLRPILASPAQESRFSDTMEEKRDTQKGKSEDEEMCEKLLETNPRNVEALKVVLYKKMQRGKTKEALEYVERLIDVEPQEVEWRLLQALCYEMLGQLSKAKKLFKNVLEKRPLLLRALHGLAMVMHKNLEGPAVFEMLDDALKVARRGKKVTEERSIRILIAQMLVVKGELDEALKEFQNLVHENPRDFRPYLCQGIIYSLQDKKNEAEEQFEIYRSLAPDEFPQRGFLDDVVLAAKTKSQQQLDKEFKQEFSYKN